jgi:hypothetical protein
MSLFRTYSLLSKDAGAIAGCRKYGNPGPLSATAFSDTLLIFDQFQGGPTWIFLRAAWKKF